LAQQNRKLGKDELMTMVRFGADEIFNARGSMITDDDIDAILAKGEERTEAMKEKIAEDMAHNLKNFSLDNVSSLYDFEGEAFAKDSLESGSIMPATFIALPARERKKNYDVDEYYRQQTGQNKTKKVKKSDEDNKPKVPVVHDFQFYQREKMMALLQKRYDLEFQRKELMKSIKEAKVEEQRLSKTGDHDVTSPDLNHLKSKQLEAELEALHMDAKDVLMLEKLEKEGFGDWSRRDLKQFVASCERFGRHDKASICQEVAAILVKDVNRVKEYFDVFWKRAVELEDYQKFMDRIERGEKRIQRNVAIKEALAAKV
jgi:SWI/SNF-related matrix-associated actin-dependent regulator of chromatin subfamily A member 5